ncbi:MAG: SPASM domain-containing protein [Elusimicrobia bacterium]|nr:SPASM domain-containing protein [Elusimicrobiota bacterium]
MWKKYWNTFLSRFAYHNRFIRPPNSPNLFAIETTSVCNLACVMCPYPIMERPKEFMDEALFKKIVDQWSHSSYLVRLHNLGEPLLDKRIASLINYAASRGVRAEISTNCTALTETRGREILGSRLFQIILSLDGASKTTYEHIRKRAEFDRVVANIHAFLKIKEEINSPVRVVLQIILMNETVSEVDNFIRQWHSYRDKGIVNELRIKRFSTWANQVQKISQLADNKLRYYPQQESQRVPCRYLWESVVVLQDGRVVPCCFDYEGKLALGDLNKQTLQEIWQGEPLRQLRQSHLEGKFDNELCRSCSEYPRSTFQMFYPFNRAGARSLWTWIQILLGKKQIIENIPVDVTPP